VAHLPLSQLQAGLTAGELHQGKLNISRHNSRQGAVFVSSLKGHTSILLRGDEALNRAIDGDIVAVRLLPEAEWTDQVDSKLADRAALAAADDDEEDGAGERDMGAMPFAADLETAVETGWGDDQTELASMGSAGAAAPNGCGGGGSGGGGPGSSAPSSGARAGSRGKRACGVVVGVVKRGWRPYVCVLDPDSGLGGNYLAEPLDQRVPRINIRRAPHQWPINGPMDCMLMTSLIAC
jgi:exosome complex exonuclease DIS3/RRP44